MRAYLTALVLIATWLPSAAWAGGTATFATTHSSAAQEANGAKGTISLEWRDAHTLRFSVAAEPGYLLVLDGEAYSVSNQDGQTQVYDMTAMLHQLRNAAGKAPSDHSGASSLRFDAIKRTDQSEAVAGIKGHVYRITWTQAEGGTKSGKAVLTDDPLVSEMTHAYLQYMDAMANNHQASRTFLAHLPGDDKGILQIGDSFKLTTISDQAPPPSRFRLPAKPTNSQKTHRDGRLH